MAAIRVNGVSLYYEARGSGPGVVLVHGSWSDADSWARVVPGLAEQAAVVAYDRRGHSRSEDLLTQGSVYEDAADLAGLIEGLGLAPAFVCGDSYGSLVTLRLAAARPDLLRGVAVHEPPGTSMLLADPDLRPIGTAFAGRIAAVRSCWSRPSRRRPPSCSWRRWPSARARGPSCRRRSGTRTCAMRRPTWTSCATRTRWTSTSPRSPGSPSPRCSRRATTARRCTGRSWT
ncbi:alpha/beta fold hydrolase [Kitasatospora aburaviensis]